MVVVDREINKVWKDDKKRIDNKIKELIRKYVDEEVTPDIHLGVCIGDDILDRIERKYHEKTENDKPANYVGIEKTGKVENENDKPAIYAGIDGITSEQKDILMMNPNHRLFPRLNLEMFETELEKSEIKAKWEKARAEKATEAHYKAKETGENVKTTKVYDVETKSLDFRNLKATDMKYNTRVKIQDFNDDEEAIRSNHLKSELKAVFVKYMKEHCDVHGNQLESNLDDKQVKAITDLKNKMKNENLVCIETDKTGKFALDKKENYIDKIQKHINMDEVITTKEVTKIENKLNKHSEHAARITKAGESIKSER